nr:unnamed protein product [Spirometra erinaceieuropaei]
MPKYLQGSSSGLESPLGANGDPPVHCLRMIPGVYTTNVRGSREDDCMPFGPDLTLERAVKTGAAIYQANRIAAARAKSATHKTQAPAIHNANTTPFPPLPTNIPRVDRSRRTSQDPVQQQLNTPLPSPPTAFTNAPIVTPAPISTASMTTTTSDHTRDAPPPPSIILTAHHPCHNLRDNDDDYRHLRLPPSPVFMTLS